MQIEGYKTSQKEGFDVFLFFSEGKNGNTPKVIAYQYISDLVYNLAFGDLNIKTGELDDLSISNNGDIIKIMATVIKTLPVFFEKHPKVNVVFKGSDELRTKLYQRIIRNYYFEFEMQYQIYGREENQNYLSKFDISKNYVEFSGFT